MSAHSFAMTARSSAAVLHARTARISSRSFILMVELGDQQPRLLLQTTEGQHRKPLQSSQSEREELRRQQPIVALECKGKWQSLWCERRGWSIGCTCGRPVGDCCLCCCFVCAACAVSALAALTRHSHCRCLHTYTALESTTPGGATSEEERDSDTERRFSMCT